MAGKFWAGLDIGVETTSVCIIDGDGQVLHEATCATTLKSVHAELRPYKRRRHFRVGLEASGGLTIARGLRSLGYSIDMYETRQLSKFLRIRRNKTDAGDAAGIAEAGRIGASLVSKVHLKNFDCQALQSILTMRRLLVRQRIKSVNLLCRQLESFGGRVGGRSTRSLQLRKVIELEIAKIFGKTDNPLISELRLLLDHAEQLLIRQHRLDADLSRMASDNELCRRFMEIPGVGPLCALTFYATVDEPHRFGRSTDVGAYLGLSPRLNQSGLSVRRGHISKMGNVAARTHLVQASMHFMRHSDADLALRAWALDVELRRGRSRARIALARKLAVLMLTMWKTGDRFLPQRIAARTADVGVVGASDLDRLRGA